MSDFKPEHWIAIASFGLAALAIVASWLMANARRKYEDSTRFHAERIEAVPMVASAWSRIGRDDQWASADNMNALADELVMAVARAQLVATKSMGKQLKAMSDLFGEFLDEYKENGGSPPANVGARSGAAVGNLLRVTRSAIGGWQ